MECLKSFSLQVSSFSDESSASEITTWGLAPQNYWFYKSTNPSSSFNIQGFKNINIFKIEVIGNINSDLGSNTVLVQDWQTHITITGQNATIGGNVNATNGFAMSVQTINPNFVLSKFNPCIEFKTPIQSASIFSLTQFQAQGIGAKNLSVLLINWNLTFNIYYNFQEENFAFL